MTPEEFQKKLPFYLIRMGLIELGLFSPGFLLDYFQDGIIGNDLHLLVPFVAAGILYTTVDLHRVIYLRAKFVPEVREELKANPIIRFLLERDEKNDKSHRYDAPKRK